MNFFYYILRLTLFLVSMNAFGQDFKHENCDMFTETNERFTCINKAQSESYFNCEQYPEVEYSVYIEKTLYKNPTHETLSVFASTIPQHVREIASNFGIADDQFEEICTSFRKIFFREIELECNGKQSRPISASEVKCLLHSFAESDIQIKFILEERLNTDLPDNLNLSFRGDSSGTISCRVFCDASCNWHCFFSEMQTYAAAICSGENQYKRTPCLHMTSDTQTMLLGEFSEAVNKYLGSK